MRRLFAPLLFVVIVAVGVGAGAGMAGRAWLDTWRAEDPGARTAAAPAPATDPTAAPAPPATHTPGDVVVEVTERDMQSQLSTMLVGKSLGATPLGAATIQSVTVALRDRQVQVGGAAKAGMLQAPFTASGTVAPNAAGRPMVSVSEATVGGVLLPEAARVALADSLQSQVDGLFADRSLRVRTIDIADGKMRVVGTAGT